MEEIRTEEECYHKKEFVGVEARGMRNIDYVQFYCEKCNKLYIREVTIVRIRK